MASVETHATLTEDLDGFLAKVRVMQPAPPTLSWDPFDKTSLRMYTQAQNEHGLAMDGWRRGALVEYHEQFRTRVLPVLKGTDSSGAKVAADPKTVGHLEDIRMAVKMVNLEARKQALLDAGPLLARTEK